MPDHSDEARRRQDRMRRRTSKLDGFFAFGPEREGSSAAKYVRGEAELRASTLLGSLRALPAIVAEASKPAGPATSGLENAVDIDPHLASLILAAGGSGFFRRGGEQPSNLVTLIERGGTMAFRNVAFVATFHGVFAEALPWYGYGPQGLWWHLVGTAVAAWKIGEALGFNPIGCEVLFLVALLHDIGKPTIQGMLGDDYPPMEAASEGGRLTVLEAEVGIVNMTHAELVPLMLDIWGVEHSIFPPAEHHHAPQRAGGQAVQASIVQLADIVANAAELGLERSYGFSVPPLERVAAKLNLAPPTVKAIREELGWAVADIATEIQNINE